MTRDELVEQAKDHLFENAATTALATDEAIQTYVSNANKKVWRYCVKKAPSLFEERVEDLPYSSDLGYLDLPGVDERGIYLLSRVLVKGADKYYPLEPLDAEERDSRGYYLEGEHLYIVPTPGDLTLQIVFIPNLPTMAAETEALAGKLEPFHDLVALEAAIALAIKDEANPSGLVMLRNEAKADLLRHLSSRQRQRPKVIREVPFA